MIPKIHAKGRSFRGAALYLLHDKDRARSSERVAWTETRNLVSDNPHVAWRLMAATAMDADRLKQQAGVKNTGRKSTESVLHVTLSWHPSEKAGLSREEMIRAANGAIKALQAESRQVLMVCHTDEPQPHVHVLVNRVSAEDGRMLTSSKEKLALSAWAQQYEQERGQTFCEQRVANNKTREQGEYTRGEADKSRNIHERETASESYRANQNRLREQMKDALLARQTREQKAHQREAWRALHQRHTDACNTIRQDARNQRDQARQVVDDAYRARREELRQQQEQQQQPRPEPKRSFFERLHTAWQSIDLRGLFWRERPKADAQQAKHNAATRQTSEEELRKHKEQEVQRLVAQRRAEAREHVSRIRAERDAALAQERARFMKDRDAIIATHQRETAALQQQWQSREQDRQRSLSRGKANADRRMTEVDRLRERPRAQQGRLSPRQRDGGRDFSW